MWFINSNWWHNQKKICIVFGCYWKHVWSVPTVTTNGVSKPKDWKDWSVGEYEEATWNSKGLNAIFNVVDVNQFKLINFNLHRSQNCMEEAGSGPRRIFWGEKIQARITCYQIWQSWDARIRNFCWLDMVNSSFALSEVYTDAKSVKKNLDP